MILMIRIEGRHCEQCIHCINARIKIEKKDQYAFKYKKPIPENDEEEFSFKKAKKRQPVIVTITQLSCNYYGNKIGKSERAETCIHYNSKKQQTDLVAFTLAEDIRVHTGVDTE